MLPGCLAFATADLTSALTPFSMLNMTGRDLKKKRVAAGVLAYVLAAEMGVASSRVSQIEALATVTPDTAARYLAALDRCAVNNTAAEAIA